ncbi:MAG TPA: ATP-dependent DNA helicase [Candidatus Dormibacteraeota bacterium]|nr:ATP-dependent DNA helicase [Candidatus Dormibacteraeota bacterium]
MIIEAGATQTPTVEQAAAIQAGPDGAFLIAAGPGTGKTYTMVQRFRWLVEHERVSPEAILAVTFTEAAATELRERLARELRRPLEEAWIGTFHGICARLLRDDAYLVGIPREIRVLDEVGQRLLVERLQARLRSGAEPGLDHDFEVLNPDEVNGLIKDGPTFALKLKGRGVSPAEFRKRALEIHLLTQAAVATMTPPAQAELEAIEVLHTIYAAYESWLQQAGRMDFDDLILAVIRALRDVPEFQERCRQRFRHVLVDEFQDTNRIQLDLVRLLAAPAFANVTVVGDAKQSIYGWRDAEIENIRTRFPGRRLPLTVNRRSVQEVLDAATAFIHRDRDFADEPELVAERGAAGQAVSVVMAADSRREARLVAAEIRRLVESGRRPGQIAVLAHSVKLLPREFEEELRAAGIPYVTTGGSGFFDREEVKDVLALVRLVADPMDDGALTRVLQGPIVRLGDAELYRLAGRRAGRYGMRLRDCLDESRAEGWPELTAGASERVERILGVTDELAAARDGMTVADVLNRLLDRSGYLRHCQLRARREGPRPILNLRKVFQMASRFERDAVLAGIADFVAHLNRIMEAVIPVGEAEVEAADAVRVLTVHGAKGLEFDVVFLVNLRRPNPRDLERLFFDPDHMGFVMKYWREGKHPRFKEHTPGANSVELARQERRRAVYVAITRARDLLYVSASREEREPSQVSAEADDHFAELLEWALAHPEAARVVKAEQLELPGGVAGLVRGPAEAPPDVGAIAVRLEQLADLGRRAAADGEPVRGPQLSFSQLHQFEVCPVRYRFQGVWRVPAPPDDLLPQSARRGGSELGAAVHRALDAWHTAGGDLLAHYEGPEAGRALLDTYLSHPLAGARTLGAEVEFNLRLGDGVRVKGVVDRVAELDGRTVLIDYKTNARLDDRLREAYSTQLRLYGLAARRGLLPGGTDPDLVLFDLRRGDAIDVRPDAESAEARVLDAARRIAAGDFALGPEHRDRPCFLCAYRPLCRDRR